MLQSWLEANCWAMGYANYNELKKAEMKGRIEHAIWGLGEWTKFVGGSTGDMYRNSTGGGASGSWESVVTREGPATWKNERQWSAHEAMGGGVPGSVVGGEQASQMGWISTFGTEGVMNGTSTRPNVADWSSSTAPKQKKTRRIRRRSISQPPTEIFIPPGVEDFDFDGVQHTADPYSLDTLGRAVHAIDLSQRQHQKQSARHSQQQPGQSSNSHSHPNLTRKQKEKERKRERMRSRAQKLQFGYTGNPGHASSDDDGTGDLNDSDFETDTEEADKENRWANSHFDLTRNKETRDRGRDTHPTYPFPSESSQQHQQQQRQYQQDQWDSNTSANNTLLPPSTSTLRGHSPNPNVNGTNNGRLSALDLFPAGSDRRGSGVSLRDPGPIPPAASANGFIPPGAEGPSRHQQSHYASDHSARNDPSYLAQLQFEAQVREYHGEKEKEERRAMQEREKEFYEGAVNTRKRGNHEGAHPGGGQDVRGRDPNVNTNTTSWHGLELRPRPNTRPEPGQRTVWHEGHLGRQDLNPYERRREEKGNEITSYRNRNGWMDA